jgi:hypothetical protein
MVMQKSRGGGERQRVEGICRAKLGFAGGVKYHFLHLAAHPLAIPGRST